MGKDREGKFHPKKGKPSGNGRSESPGLKEVNTEDIENYIEIAEKYTLGEEEPAPNIRVTHPNRNVDKREERAQQKPDNNDDANESYKSKTQTFTVERSQTVPEELPISITKEQLASLAGFKSDPCISIYLQTTPSGVEKNEQKDSIAFKNALQQVTYQLRQKGSDQTIIEKLLQPGYDLIRDNAFWLNLSKGLAVFISENELKYMKLPVQPKEEILVNTSYYLAPIIPLVSSYDYFYLLVLSKKQAKLYRADKFGMVYLPIPEMPNGVDDVVHLEEKDDQKLFRTESQGGGHGANYHGIGSGKPDEKANIAIYFDEVDETAMKAVLNKETVPLLLAGVDYLIPIYKSVAEYKFIWEESMTGSYEHQNGNIIHEEALHVMEPYFQQRNTKALEMYANNSATERTSSTPADVIPAAFYSRVWHLFVLKDAHIWGTFDEMKNELFMHETQMNGDECLIDKAIMKTILNGGEVHILEKEQMPADSKIAALMRY
jgi:hypothetical protein